MTYLTFHLVFTVPPIVAMAILLRRPLAGVGGWRARSAIPLLTIIAFTYTTPWDNYLVAREVWWYGPDRVLATLGHVPVEEYAFFILQPILTGLFLFHLLSRAPGMDGAADRSRTSDPAWWGAGFWLTCTAAGGALLLSSWAPGLYMGLIVAWASPVLAGMWLYDGEMLWAMRRTLLFAVGIPTLYLWIADAIAIHLGIWTISPDYTLGLAAFGLPIEEATFFLMTNLLVVKGILLLLFGDHQAVPVRQSATHDHVSR
jgi:lycopene cyclase domain-containing protein